MAKYQWVAQKGVRQRGLEPNDTVAERTSPERTGKAPPTSYSTDDTLEFTKNMLRAAIKGQLLVSEFARHQFSRKDPGQLDPLNLTGVFTAFLRGMATNPASVVDAQFKLWRDFMDMGTANALRLMGAESAQPIAPSPSDRRFKDADWQNNQVFAFIKESYLLTANWLENTVADMKGLDPDMHRRVAFYAKQFADALAPSNFVLTNPEVLRETIKTRGKNLVRGLQNLLDDLDRGGGQISIRRSADAFKVGENIATTPGKVVFRNALFELLQYEPQTTEVYERPLLIIPPWINKFYIMDLQPNNSLIRWLVSQGYTVFVISWVNPDPRLAQKTFEDYTREGIFAALSAVEQATGVHAPNTVGYCIGGTLLSIATAFLAAKGDARVHSATFYAAQNDFSEAGDLRVFIDNHQLDAVQHLMRTQGGVLEGRRMASAFNMMRANDLIWSFVVSNYLLGREPVPFDLLYWNSDSTRMPEVLHIDYLRRCYRDNALAKGEFELAGEKIDLGRVTIPVYLQSAKEDHIAPYPSIYKTTQLFKGPIRFIVAGSGHIAGVINPPSAHKYQYWTNDEVQSSYPDRVEDWFSGATEHPGSWWIDWDKWLSKLSGPKIPARHPGDHKLKVLCDAPGSYVKIKAE